MQEDFLHYIWKYKKFDTSNLKTIKGEAITLVSSGQHNLNSGPDFFNSQLKIDDQFWAGNVEIHVKSSDWFVHNHENDKVYDNVILHVVWEHDADVFRKDNSVIPTLVLKHYVSNNALSNYQKLFSKSQKWINCENDFETVDDFVISNWLERLYFERLERKSLDIENLLKESTNNWEAVLFKMIFKNFGLKINGDSFLSIANSIDYSVLKKSQAKIESLEALFFGQAELLESDIQDVYFLELQKEYRFLKQKFNLNSFGVVPLKFFRLRPPNFPTIRLSQLSRLYHSYQNLFARIVESQTKEDFYNLLMSETSEYWQTHYSFGKQTKKSKKRLTKQFVDLLLINTIIPIKFSFAKYQDKDINDEIIKLITEISSEKNSIVETFNSFKPISNSAMQSQALIQLKTKYCDKNRCLQCEIGNTLLNRN
ncbi:MAG TPA: DUF2851 family protein [Flavobacteriaceae bacterium]|nr:DUF2851 family protein [Flavobacteriaceae bacterium]